MNNYYWCACADWSGSLIPKFNTGIAIIDRPETYITCLGGIDEPSIKIISVKLTLHIHAVKIITIGINYRRP